MIKTAQAEITSTPAELSFKTVFVLLIVRSFSPRRFPNGRSPELSLAKPSLFFHDAELSTI